MTLEQLNAFCASLKATTHGVQWGGSDVWKVGPSWEKGKVFVVASHEDGEGGVMMRASFKVSEIAWEVLQGFNGCRPAPYLASRGMKWIQADGKRGLTTTELRGYLQQSHALVVQGLTKKTRAELGLDGAP